MYTINVYSSPYLARFSAGGQNDHDDHNPLSRVFSPPHVYILPGECQRDLKSHDQNDHDLLSTFE